MKKKRHQSNQTEDATIPADDVFVDKVNVDDVEQADTQDVGAVDQSDTAGGQGDNPEMTPQEVIHSLQDKIASLEDALLRQKAEGQNVQRRAGQQRLEAIRFANADLMKSLLSVVDDFQRSLDAATSTDNVASVVDGIKLVYDNFMKAMTDAGLEPIEAIHQPFDPHVHEAMLQQPTDECAPDIVIEEITKGFKLHERTLRPARVIVSKAIDKASPKTPATDE